MKQFYSKFLRLSFTVAGFALMSAQYSNGYIVANEGNYGTPNGEISYIDANNNLTNNVYSLANNGEALGDILQSIYFNADKSYLVLNNSNKIVVANRSSFLKSATITSNIDRPRSTTIANGKIFTTNAGDYADAVHYVSVHDATTLAYITSIPLSEEPEELVTANGKVYVNKSSFRAGNSIEVINPATNAITSTITLSPGLQSIIVVGNDIFALCIGSAGSTVYKINTTTDTVTSSITNAAVLPASQYDGLKFTTDGTKLFIAGGTNVYSLNTDLATFSSTPIFTTAASGYSGDFYGFAAIDGKIFQGNANDYINNSTLNVYNQTGTLLNTFTTTRSINNIYKNVFVPGSLATAETKVNNVISIYPNPVSDILYVKNADGAQFKIVDLSGRIVKSGVYQNGITVSGLNKGNYIIQISGKNIQTIEKFIIK
ncbi:T9SS type A sorting domain-containing protein [Chryseobacterium foetidum]|uniref:T9SS type A sorting domain-containing protein n=1 Tax=Chryseobacterium foetidum TaxID=2951057 RepID=UPI0021C82960|nr:T9SS type A sorting domain-containing protein [Chryseobacterium foetidum]